MNKTWLIATLTLTAILTSNVSAADTTSLFEDYFAKANGQIPFPITEIRRALSPQDSEASLNDILFVPTGRSIQRANTDLCHPRLVTAVESPNGATYIGYSEKAAEAEIISWNDSRGRYEFLVMKNYGANSKPELARAERPLCLSCHQNGGPLFPRAPWREVDNPFQMKQFYDTCLHGEKMEPIQGAYKEYLGVRVYGSYGHMSTDPRADNGTSCLLSGLNPGCKMDGAVRSSEILLQEKQACRSLCAPGDSACSEELKRLTLPQASFLPLNAIDQAILQRLTDGALPTSILPDRNPNLSEPNVYLLQNKSATDLNIDVINGDILTTGSEAKWADPKEKRVSSLEFLGFDFMTLAKRSAVDQAGALTSLVRNCLSKGPSALLPIADETAQVEMPPTRSGPALFQFYCGKCHGEGSNYHLPLTDLAKLREVRSDFDESAEDLLKDKQMPRTAPGVPTLSDSDRAALVQLLDPTGTKRAL